MQPGQPYESRELKKILGFHRTRLGALEVLAKVSLGRVKKIATYHQEPRLYHSYKTSDTMAVGWSEYKLTGKGNVVMKYGPFDPILRPYLTDAPTAPKLYSRAELLKAVGITPRQLNYYIQLGAVARPLGHTRAAKYTVSHLHQAQRVVELLGKHQTSVAEIAQAYASHTPGSRPVKRSSSARSKTAERLVVHRLTDGIRIVVDEELLPTERKLLEALLKTGKMLERDRLRLATEAVTRESRLLEQVVPRRRPRAP